MRFTLFALLILLGFPALCATWIGGEGNWEDSRNWDTGTVPGLNETAILPQGEIIINTAVLVGAVVVESEATLIVASGADLAIDPHGGPTFALDVAGTMYVFGSVRRGGQITTSASLRVQVTGNWQTMPGGLLSIELGYLRLNTNASIFYNDGDLMIENNTIAAVLEGTLVNNGTMSCEGISTASSAVSIEQGAEWANNGLASISGFSTAIDNQNHCYNSGQLFLSNCRRGISNSELLENRVGGLLYLSNVLSYEGIDNRFSFSRIRNWGRLEIEGDNCFFAIDNHGRIDNYSNGRIYMNGQYRFSAIENRVDANFYNHGLTAVGNDFFDGDRALYNSGYFMNSSGGECLFFEGSSLYCITNREVFENEGYCQLAGEVFNGDYLLNTNCGEMIVDGRITNNGRTWINEGMLRILPGNIFGNINNGQFLNASVIEDRAGAVDPFSIDNEGVLAQPYAAAAGWNPDFFELGVAGQVPLNPICFAEPEGDEVGVYDVESNGLELYPDAIGLTELYFFDEDCEYWFVVDVPAGVQSSLRLLGDEIVHTEPALGFQLYPNPTKGRAELKLPTMLPDELHHWVLYNSGGQLMQQGQTYAGAPVAMDLSTMPVGIYLLRVSNPQGEWVYSERLVKQ